MLWFKLFSVKKEFFWGGGFKFVMVTKKIEKPSRVQNGGRGKKNLFTIPPNYQTPWRSRHHRGGRKKKKKKLALEPRPLLLQGRWLPSS